MAAEIPDTLYARGNMPLADACVTEWRRQHSDAASLSASLCHSLMLVLLNGGASFFLVVNLNSEMPLADACVTEWRLASTPASWVIGDECHSLMLVLLNGGTLTV